MSVRFFICDIIFPVRINWNLNFYQKDTIVAMEALTEYAYRARLREITDMTVVVDASASPDAKELVRISSDTLSTVHTIDASYLKRWKN